MHLVFATAFLPTDRSETGRELADRAIVAGLRRAGATVTLLGFETPGATLSDPDNSLSLGELEPPDETLPLAQKLRALAAAIAGGLTWESARLRGAGAAELPGALSRLQPFDGLVVSGADLAGAFEPAFGDYPVLFLAHDAAHMAAREAAAHAIGVTDRLIGNRDARCLDALQRRLCTKARRVLTFAEDDRAAFGLAGDPRALVLPLAMPEPPPQGVRIPGFDVGLIGDWTDMRERIGLEWFLQRVVPALHPHVMVSVAGRIPRGFRSRHQRVLLLGEVDDPTEFMRQCRVLALPSSNATGVQARTIKALELGLPAAATSAALRGVDRIPDNVRRADKADAFAAGLQELIVGHRTGTIADSDGAAFRAERLARLDAALVGALQSLAAGTR